MWGKLKGGGALSKAAGTTLVHKKPEQEAKPKRPDGCVSLLRGHTGANERAHRANPRVLIRIRTLMPAAHHRC